ncbi:MAG: sodium:calcium antiporter [Micavibrio aeruginosavorus]|uniref:Sodium:calcium antiporter n=1 Tax=Micavibrio aeruginosavorus TaxID=349221 RepID=A0A2W5B660_9BACT|nr:MAG: sodium:calcium antiporter [Micavibrio aeruginosavorus]
MDFLYIAVGLVLLFFGGEGLLKGSVSLARRFGLSNFLIGAVVVGFGTSMPELSVSLKAAFDNASGIVVGNVVGSNIANILLILGICAFICPILVTDRSVFRDVFVMIFGSVLLCAFALTGVINLAFGAVFFAGLIVYIIYSYKQDRQKSAAQQAEIIKHVEEDTEGAIALPLWQALLYVVIGLALLAGGATLLVEGASAIARGFGISETVIGLSLVAVGTSLPELATGVVAAWRKHTDIILGNIIGSNIFNIMAILGITAIISPVEVPEQIVNVDMWVMLAVSVLLGILLRTSHRLSRLEGVAMFALYGGYMGWLFLNNAA